MTEARSYPFQVSCTKVYMYVPVSNTHEESYFIAVADVDTIECGYPRGLGIPTRCELDLDAQRNLGDERV